MGQSFGLAEFRVKPCDMSKSKTVGRKRKTLREFADLEVKRKW